MHRIVIVGAVFALLAGCVNGFEKFYRPLPADKLAQVKPMLLPPPPTPAVYYHSADVQADAKRLMEDGTLAPV